MLKAPGHSFLPPKKCSHFESPLLPDPTPTKHRFVVAPPSMTAMMTAMPRSGNNATSLGNNATPLGARSATTTACSGDDANLGDDATPLGACSVNDNTKLGDDDINTKLGNNSTLGNDATLTDDATPFGDNTKLVARTLLRDTRQQRHAR